MTVSGFIGGNRQVIDWLLEEEQPSVRYRTLIDILDCKENDPDVMEARSKIASKGWAKDILAKQTGEGIWADSRSLYRPKYVSTNWMLLILSDLGLTRDDPGIDKACQNWIKLFRTRDGGFAGSNKGGARYGHVCTTGNTARALVRFGYEDHPSVRRAFEWFVRNQAEKGGWSCFDFGTPRKGRNLDSWEPLGAFAVYPRQKWTRSMKSAVERGAEFFLERELHVQGERYEPWYRFHYPVHYYYDILVGLDFLTALGYTDDRRLEFAVSFLKKRMRRNGRWILDSVNPDPESPQGRWNTAHPKQATIPFSLEAAGKPSRMITLTALSVLKRMEGKG